MAKFFAFFPPSGGGSSANPSVGTNGATAPTSSTQIAGQNPTGNLTPVQTDANGNLITTPLAGSVQHVIVDSSALPTGASTSALQTSGNASLTSIDGKTPALGQALSAASVPVVLPAAQITTLTPQTNALTDAQLRASPVPVTTGGLTDTQLRATPVPVSGTVSTGGLTDTQLRATPVPVSVSSSALPTGAATEATLASLNGKVTAVNTGAVVVSSSALPTGAATETTLSAINTKTPTQGQTTMANSSPVVIASNQTAIPVTTTPANTATATASNVTSSASNVTLLAANSARFSAAFFNDSTAALYLKFGATASTTSYTVQIPAGGYYEMPLPIYTGIVDGIWAAANGAARVTSW